MASVEKGRIYGCLAAGVAAAVLLSGCSGSESGKDEPAPVNPTAASAGAERAARLAVAARSICTLEAVTSVPGYKIDHAYSPGDREALKITVKTGLKASAKPAMEAYAHDNRVVWPAALSGRGYLKTDSGNDLVVAPGADPVSYIHAPIKESGTSSFVITPLKKYSPGSQIDIKVTGQASTSDEPDTYTPMSHHRQKGTGHTYQAEAGMYCGTLSKVSAPSQGPGEWRVDDPPHRVGDVVTETTFREDCVLDDAVLLCSRI